ncbi:hypothetical protein GCM10010483_35450 [Actinokineospora diospyrosa]
MGRGIRVSAGGWECGRLVGMGIPWVRAGAGSAVGSMGRTCFARGPYDTRGRSAQQGPKRLALPRGNATGVVPPRKQVRPIEQEQGWGWGGGGEGGA